MTISPLARLRREQRRIARTTRFAAFTDEERDNAAILCSCRASDEASGRMFIGGVTARRSAQMVSFNPNHWSTNERGLAVAAFHVAADRLGCVIGNPPVLWAEAEAMIRTGFVG